MSWSGILGQPLVVRLLRQSVATGRVAHAYLFNGMGGLGKRAVALELAKVLNCASPGPDGACDACSPCQQIAAGSHPDLLVVEPEGRSVRIEQMRELQRQLYLRPQGRRRIGIIDGADRMGIEAANSVLKLLEEPPGYAVLILLVTNMSGVLPTILSRCQLVNFSPMAPDAVRQALEAKGIEPTAATVAAALSGGSLGQALALASHEAVAGRREEVRTFLDSLARADDATLLATAEELDKRRDDLSDWLELLLLWLRDALVIAEGADASLLVNRDGEGFLHGFARRHGAGALHAMLAGVSEVERQLQRNANTRLVLDVMMLKLGTIAAT